VDGVDLDGRPLIPPQPEGTHPAAVLQEGDPFRGSEPPDTLGVKEGVDGPVFQTGHGRGREGVIVRRVERHPKQTFIRPDEDIFTVLRQAVRRA
jgi:hypothetical protein